MRLRNVLLAVGSFVIFGFVVAYIERERFMQWAMKPRGSFSSQTPPPAPDYSKREAWAARPDTEDLADIVPPGLAGPADQQASATADVFFIHPTTYFSGKEWNAAYDLGGSPRTILENGVLRHQASIFNACCRVFVPRYRQAALYSFRDEGPDGAGALNLAYSDVERAFEHFIKVENANRPFIIAGHSQGALHAVRLWQEHIAGTPLQARLVAAYIVGYAVPKELAKDGLPACESPTQTGCVASWRTYQKGLAIKHQEPRVWLHGALVTPRQHENVCVNPLTWTAAAGVAAQNLGSLPYSRKPGKALHQLVRGLVGATCEEGRLRIDVPQDPAFGTSFMGKGNYHVLDYGLFYQNVRDNAAARVRAFTAAH